MEVIFWLTILFFFQFSDAVVSQILDELGLQLTDQLSGLPQATASLSASGSKVPLKAGDGMDHGSSANDTDADLQARLDNLRREWYTSVILI